MRRADDRPNKASQGLGPSLSALPPCCPLCSLLPPRSATVPPVGTCGPALIGPSWTPTFPLSRTPAPALVSVFPPLSLSTFSPRWHSFRQDIHCLGDVFSTPPSTTTFCSPCHSHFVIFSCHKYDGRVMWSKSGPGIPRRSGGQERLSCLVSNLTDA